MDKSPIENLLSRKSVILGVGLIIVASLFLIVLSQNGSNTQPTPTPTQPPAPSEPSEAHMPTIPPDKQIEGQIIVKFNPSLSDAEVNQALSKYNASVIKKIEGINYTVVKVPKGQENILIQKLKTDGVVQDAQGDFTNHAMYVPNDEFFGIQYAYNNTGQAVNKITGKANADIRAEAAWDVTKGSGVKVAILDTGINLSHPDLAGKVAVSKAFTTTSVEDQVGHGTHVAGIIAADTNNTTGVAGTCPECQLIIGKVLGDDETGSTSDVASGITWAADQGAKVINLSLGTTSQSSQSIYQQAIDYAVGKGAVVVAAAGNCGGSNYALNGCTTINQTSYPGANNNVVSVASTDNSDAKSSFSNYGSYVQVAAPGSNIVSTLPNHTNKMGVTDYGYLSGTSMATPVTSGVIALIWASQYGTSNTAVINRLYATVDPIAGTGQYWNKGRINAAKAVGASTTPTVTVAPTTVNPTYVCAGSPAGNVCPPTPTNPGGATILPSAYYNNGTPSPTGGNGTTPGAGGNLSPTAGGGSTVPSPTVNPCDAGSSVTIASNKHHRKHRGGRGGGFLEQFFKFLFKLLEQLLQKFGIQFPGNPGGGGGGGTPCPTPTETQPPVSPTQGTEQPSTAPSTATSPTTTTTVAPTGGGSTGDPTATTCGSSANTPSSPVTGYKITGCEDFNESSMPNTYSPYSSGGGSTVVGAGRKASQCTVGGGMLTLTQLADGSTCGGSMSFAQKYGYWEVRMKTYSTGGSGSAPHPVLILWPDTDVWADGELDYFESDIGEKGMNVFLHCVGNPSSNCYNTSADVDITQWHVYGFEWTSAGFVGYIDGKQIYTTDGKGSNPSVAMHQTIQLDNLSGKTPAAPGKMDVDWVHMYSK